jgi:hypothetical protein
LNQFNQIREKELWHNKVLNPTAHQQIHRNYLQDNEVKPEASDIYDVSLLLGSNEHLFFISETNLNNSCNVKIFTFVFRISLQIPQLQRKLLTK